MDRSTSGTWHLPFRKGTFEDCVGIRGQRKSLTKWRRDVIDVIARLIAALQPDEVVLGGGNVQKLKTLPPRCRLGHNANAFLGGFRLWKPARKGKRKEHGRGKANRITDRKRAGKRQAWKALEAHNKEVRECHLRQLFAMIHSVLSV